MGENGNISQNSLLLKITAWLIGTIGTLLTVISVIIMGKITNLQHSVDALIPQVAVQTEQIKRLYSDMTEMRSDVKTALDFRNNFIRVYGLKADDVE